MRKLLFNLFAMISVIGFASFALLIECLNWILLVCIAVGIIGAVGAYFADSEYIHKILTEGDEV